MVTKKQFREYLNRWDEARGDKAKTFRSHRFHQAKRFYGDYLYAQDRDMFNDLYRRWQLAGCPSDLQASF